MHFGKYLVLIITIVSWNPTCVAQDDDFDWEAWWESFFDDYGEDYSDVEWEESEDGDSLDLTGEGVCTRQTLETRYYYENVTYPCWKYIEVPCDRRKRGSSSRRNRRQRQRDVCYEYVCETCYDQVRRCGYETVTRKFCCQGYEDNGQGGCSRVIQCRSNNGGCSQLCKSDAQDHHCDCFPGFQLVNRTTCIDINECTSGISQCNQICHNNDGNYYCGCKSGYALIDPTTCEDINECEFGNGGCEHQCVNTEGAFYCLCDTGYQLDRGFMCNDVDECATYNGGCSHVCHNVDGGYNCSCREGFELGNDQKTCTATIRTENEGTVPSDLPRVASEDNEDDSSINAGLIGGIVGGIIGLGLLVLLGVILAKYFCIPHVFAAAGVARSSDGVYETPIAGSKGIIDAKGPGYTDLAFDNGLYAANGPNIIPAKAPDQPPAYSETDPVESPYSDVSPPMYDNIHDNGIQTPSDPATYDNLDEVTSTKTQNYDNKAYDSTIGPSVGDIVNAKNALKPTGSKNILSD